MSQTSVLKKTKVDLAVYSELVRRVRQTIAQGKERAADAVEREKVRTCWETGKLIHEHILLNKNRANYGQQVLKKLSKDLGISETELYYMTEYAKAEPIFRPAGKLSWGHIQTLLRINDDEERRRITTEAIKNDWTRKDLREEIKKRQLPQSIEVIESLIAKRGTLNIYQIVIAELGPWQGKPVIDLGFSNYFRTEGKFSFEEGDFVQWTVGAPLVGAQQKGRVQDPPLHKISNVTAAELFTYRVFVDEVTDGDTIWVLVDLGFGFTTKQCLRFRGLDAPEIATRDGQAAKKFLERQFKFKKEVVITSTKSDKYDRYLADVWAGETYLNQKLIDKGLAVRVSE